MDKETRERSDRMPELEKEALALARNHKFGPAWEKMVELREHQMWFDQHFGRAIGANPAAWEITAQIIAGLERAHDRRRNESQY